MLQNLKIEYCPEMMCQQLSFDAPGRAFGEKLWEAAERLALEIRGMGRLTIWDGERTDRAFWLSLEAMNGAGIAIDDKTFKIFLPAEYDALDGTLWNQPIDSESCWARFVPICRELLKLAA